MEKYAEEINVLRSYKYKNKKQKIKNKKEGRKKDEEDSRDEWDR